MGKGVGHEVRKSKMTVTHRIAAAASHIFANLFRRATGNGNSYAYIPKSESQLPMQVLQV